MVDDWVIKTMYATKRRRKNSKSVKPLGIGSRHEQNAKSNPSKRHRERLNSELEHLASLLPFEQNVIVKLDKLSILRLAVSYLRMKCYFQAFSYDRPITENRLVSHLYPCPLDLTRIEGEACLQAFNGFIFIMSCDGEVFSVSKTVEHYLGFHQADILHQSILELIHSEDREEFRRQLSWRNNLPPELNSCTINDLMTRADLSHYLKRRFTVRFRCLLDNTSGFITLEISGRLQFIYGQARGKHSSHLTACHNPIGRSIPGTTGSCSASSSTNKNTGGSQLGMPPLGMFVVCSPLGPVPSLNGSQRDMTFKTKHQLDLTVMSADSRTRVIFNYTDNDLQRFKVYDLVHPEDLRYVAQGHREVLQTGSVGLLVHRWLSKSGTWIWLQSRVKLVLKNGKQDHIVAIHRQLSYQEGMEMLSRRSDEYKLPFPLLEPETLLNEDGIPHPERQLSEYNGSFVTSHLQDMEYNYLGSVINGGSGGILDRPRSDYLFDPAFRNSEQIQWFREASNQNTSKHCITAQRKPVDSLTNHNCTDPSPTPNLFTACNKTTRSSASRGRMQGRPVLGRKKKYTTKENRFQEIEPLYPDYSNFTGNVNFNLSVNAHTYDYLYDQCEFPCLASGSFQPRLRWGSQSSAGTTDPSSRNSLVPHIANVDHLDFGNHWPNAYQTPNGLRADFSSEVTRQTSGKNQSTGVSSPGHRSDCQHYQNLQNYSAYPLTYDAYAVAAAAMVAAASGCRHEQYTKPHSSECYELFPSLDRTMSNFYQNGMSEENSDRRLDQNRTNIDKMTTYLPWSVHAFQHSVKDHALEDESTRSFGITNKVGACPNAQSQPRLATHCTESVENRTIDTKHFAPTSNDINHSENVTSLVKDTPGARLIANENSVSQTRRISSNYDSPHIALSSEVRMTANSLTTQNRVESTTFKPAFLNESTSVSLLTERAYSQYWSDSTRLTKLNAYDNQMSGITSSTDVGEIIYERDKRLTFENKSTSSVCSTGSSRSHSPVNHTISEDRIQTVNHSVQHSERADNHSPQGIFPWSTEREQNNSLDETHYMDVGSASSTSSRHGYRLEEMHSAPCEMSAMSLSNPLQIPADPSLESYRERIVGPIG